MQMGGVVRPGFERGDLTALLVGGGLTLAVTVATVREGTALGFGVFLVVTAFLAVLTAWLLVPHWTVALTIPLFALIPAGKVIASPVIGPTKDLVTIAAAGAVLVTVIQRHGRPDAPRIDRLLMILIVAFLALYAINLGGGTYRGHHGLAWAQGVRLTAEPFILLAAGLTLNAPRKTLRYAVPALIATGCGVTLVGIYQQLIGDAGLLGLGYTYEGSIRHIGGRLRSFGTLDEPFAYSALLLLAISAVVFWLRRGPFKAACLTLLTVGLGLAYVRSAIFIAIALVALWLVRSRRTAIGLFLLAASVSTAVALLFAVAGANETRSIQAGPSTYLTLNGRTSVWSTVFANPSKLPFGLGVGEVGTAAERASFGVTADPRKARKKTVAVDSGYFATVADVGLVGLALLLGLLARLVALAVGATRRPGNAGWLVLGWLTVLTLDAVTRASFTGFPTAFLGMLLVGVGLAAASFEGPADARPARI